MKVHWPLLYLSIQYLLLKVDSSKLLQVKCRNSGRLATFLRPSVEQAHAAFFQYKVRDGLKSDTPRWL